MINLRSKLRRKLFARFFTNPDANYYVRELARLLDVDAKNLSTELARLEGEGLFVSQVRGRQKYFRLNRNHPLYEEFRRIVFKTIGAVGQLRNALAHMRGIEEAYLYGSFARNQTDAKSDIDVLIVGEPEAEKFEEVVRKLERQLGREINYTLMSPREFKSRRKKKDPFLEDIWRHKKISLLAA